MIPLDLFDYDDTDDQEPATLQQDWIAWSLPFSPTLGEEYLLGMYGWYFEIFE